MKTKKLLLNALPLLLIGTAMVYAAAPSGGYLPGATTDPACAPGDTDCVVQLPSETPNKFVDGSTSSDAVFTAGKVGIGTTSPKRSLHIVGDVDSAAEIRLESNSSAASGSASHFVGYRSRGTQLAPTEPLEDDMLATFQGRSAVSPYSYAGMRIYAAEDFTATEQGSYISFNSTDIGAIGSSERMRIASNGNVGVGTTSPTEKLHIKGTLKTDSPEGEEAIIMRNSSNGSDWNYTLAGDSTSAANLYLNRSGVGNIVTYKASGNVGIGTSNPTAKLEVRDGNLLVADQTGGVNPREGGEIQIETSSNSAGGRFYIDSYYNNTGSGSEILRLRSDQNSNIVNLDRNGNVGIGITSPSEKLEVEGKVKVNGQIQVDIGGVLIQNSNNSVDNKNWLIAHHNSDNLIISSRKDDLTNKGHYFTIQNTTGNIGIGTTSPTAKLDVAGGIKTQGLDVPIVYETNTFVVSGTTQNGSGAATCQTGYKVIGGGCQAVTWGSTIVSSHPNGGDDSWRCNVKQTYTSNENATAYAICMKVTP